MTGKSGQRRIITVNEPRGGWLPPWPQCFELAQTVDSSKWTLIGGLMVQMHALIADIHAVRPTTDMDMVLHVETGAISGPEITRALSSLGYQLQVPLHRKAIAHRFIRTVGEQEEVVDVMIADHARPKPPLYLGHRKPFAVPAGTQALQRTFTCIITDATGKTITDLSMPTPIAALILKGAAFREDSRDRERHLEDAAVLASILKDPVALVPSLKGSDRSRLLGLHENLSNPQHRAWSILEPQHQKAGIYALDILTRNPQEFDLSGGVGPAI